MMSSGLYFLIMFPDPYLIAAVVGKPGFRGISTFLVPRLVLLSILFQAVNSMHI